MLSNRTQIGFVVALLGLATLGCSSISESYYLSVAAYKTNEYDYEGAIAYYTKAIKSSPDNVKAYIQRGHAKADLIQYDHEKDPSISNSNRAIINSARSDFDQAIKIDPYNADAFLGRGQLNHQSNNFQAAIDDQSMAIDINPRSYQAYYWRGLSKKAMDNNAMRACIDWKMAAQLWTPTTLWEKIYSSMPGDLRSKLGITHNSAETAANNVSQLCEQYL